MCCLWRFHIFALLDITFMTQTGNKCLMNEVMTVYMVGLFGLRAPAARAESGGFDSQT